MGYEQCNFIIFKKQYKHLFHILFAQMSLVFAYQIIEQYEHCNFIIFKKQYKHLFHILFAQMSLVFAYQIIEEYVNKRESVHKPVMLTFFKCMDVDCGNSDAMKEEYEINVLSLHLCL